MAINHYLAVLSAIISVFGVYLYLKNTILGKTKPNRVSWLMWAFAPIVGASAALAGGADFFSNSRIFLAGILPFLVFIASFLNKNAYWQISRFDLFCGGLSLIAFVLWFFVDSPALGVLLTALGDSLASVPTIVKAYTAPQTETPITYATSLLSVLVIMPTIPEWNIVGSVFHLQLVLQNLLILLAIFNQPLRKFFTLSRGSH